MDFGWHTGNLTQFNLAYDTYFKYPNSIRLHNYNQTTLANIVVYLYQYDWVIKHELTDLPIDLQVIFDMNQVQYQDYLFNLSRGQLLQLLQLHIKAYLAEHAGLDAGSIFVLGCGIVLPELIPLISYHDLIRLSRFWGYDQPDLYPEVLIKFIMTQQQELLQDEILF